MEEKKLSYEDAFKQLEDIVEKLEGDKSSLNESVELFKKGVELYKYCNNLLSNAEGEVKVLLDNSNDSLIELDFLGEAEGDSF
ncbi:exodeoxyribonuclease VII small subunit [Tissierella creatinophila]|nr:exodeoxyribonuclease VII small subunit [Tissierella creatinophila]